jgi:hypothetical protein
MAFKGKLMASGGNAKTVKGDKLLQYETAIMYLAPYTSAGGTNVCPMAETAKCIEGCLNTAGRAALFNSIPRARIAKTQRYLTDRKSFLIDLVSDVEAFVRYCERKGVKPAVRLNGTSDIQWERGHSVSRKHRSVDGWSWDWVTSPSIMAAFPEVQFYDYTKIPQRVERGALPGNYALTLSYSGANAFYAEKVLAPLVQGRANVAVVFRSKARVKELLEVGHWHGRGRVIDGDETDMRFLDPQGGYVVALYAKGKAKADCSGFVVD